MEPCPICSEDRESEFGICRSRKTGRNLYCKSCIRKKVKASRDLLREYRQSRQRALFNLKPAHLWAPKVQPIDRVRKAIAKGFHTQKQIRTETSLQPDTVADAIADLMLTTNEIRTEVIDGTRMYFMNEPKEVPVVVQRKPDVPCSFSSMEGLMPGRKKETKVKGWVAA